MTFVSTQVAAFTIRDDKPGYLVTVDGRGSIALCGGWEMSTTCRRGPADGARHSSVFGGRHDDGFWCRECDMPLHLIGADPEYSQLMSIEPHIIEELPW